MADRLNTPEFEPNVFNYVGDPEPHENYIDVIVETGLKPVSVKRARLPRKLIRKRMIMIFHNDKQVSIPAFLCERQKLI